MYIYGDIWLSSSWNEKCCRQKFVGKNQTHILCSVTFFGNRAVYEIMWKNTCREGQATGDNMAHAHLTLTTATNTHLEYVMFTAVPR